MVRSAKKYDFLVRVSAAAVVLAVGAILVLPLFISQDEKSRGVEAAAGTDSVGTNNSSPPTSAPSTPNAGPLEQDLLSWMAPLLNPGQNTTAFENITPNVRAIRLKVLVTFQRRRIQGGIDALDQLAGTAERVQKRVELLTRMGAFNKQVETTPAATLWRALTSRPLVDRGRVADTRQILQAAIARLTDAEASGFQQLDDPRLDCRHEISLLDQTVVWVGEQISDLRRQQRDLDRVEFTVWLHAKELPPAAPAPASPSNVRQVLPNPDLDQHLQMTQATLDRLESLRQQSMDFLRSLAKLDAQVHSFLAESEYRNDPVAAQWGQVPLISATFLKDLHIQEMRVEKSQQAILQDSHYTPSVVLAPVVEANEWAKANEAATRDRQIAAQNVMDSIKSTPVFNPGVWGEIDGRVSAREKWRVTDVAERRLLLARHSYAMTFDRPANRYNWAWADILEPYVSYDYWWRWATDAGWYRGSDVRLDPAKFPKDAAGTRKLWREFRSIVDADGRLNTACIRAVLQDGSVKLGTKDAVEPNVPASAIRAYWASIFLPDEMAREVGYLRPPITYEERARLLSQTADPEDASAVLNLPWSAPYVFPRKWRWADDKNVVNR